MAEGTIEILVTPERTMLDDNNIRNSTGKTSTSSSRKKILPHYLRASTGSCHDFCKYGRKVALEAVGNRHIPRRIATTMVSVDEKLNVAIISAMKKKTATKLRPSLDSKTQSPSSSGTIKHEASPFGKKKVASVKQILSPAEQTEVSLSQPSSPAEKFEVSSKQALLPAKKVEVSPVLAPSPARKIEVAGKQILSPSKKVDVSPKHAPLPGKKIEVSRKQVSATEKIEDSPKQALLLGKKVDASRKQVSAAKKVEVSPKQALLLAKKIEVSRKQVSAAKDIEVSPKQALLPAMKIEVSRKQVSAAKDIEVSPKQVSAAKDIEVSPKQALLPAKKIEVSRKQVSAAKDIEVSPKQALLPAKKIEVSQTQALSPAKKTEISPKQALLSIKKTEVSQKQVQSPAKKLEASRKQIVSLPKRSNNCANPEGSSEPKFIAAKRSPPSSLLRGIGGKRNGDRKTVKKIGTPRMDEKKMLRTPIALVSPTSSMLSTTVSRSEEADSRPKSWDEVIEAEPMLFVPNTENTLCVIEQPESNCLVPSQSGSHTNQLSSPTSSMLSTTVSRSEEADSRPKSWDEVIEAEPMLFVPNTENTLCVIEQPESNCLVPSQSGSHTNQLSSPTSSMLSTTVSRSEEADSRPKSWDEVIEAEPMLFVPNTENTLCVIEQPESNCLVPSQSGSHTNQLSSPTSSMLSTTVSRSEEADSSPKSWDEVIEAEPMLFVPDTENTLCVIEQPESNCLVPSQSGSHTNQLSAPSSSSSLSSPINPLSSPSSPLLSVHGEPLNSLSFPSSPLLSIHSEEEDPVSDYDETENEESEFMLGEADDAISEYDETENEDQVEASTVLYKKPAKEGGHPDNTDCLPQKLSFNRGKVVSLPSENSSPRKLRFRRGRVLGENDVRGDTGRKSFRRREVTRGKSKTDGTESDSEKVVLRHQDVQGKKDAQGLFNNVIEETASKLVESRKSKVKALVGAFETVISLQDLKPSTD